MLKRRETLLQRGGVEADGAHHWRRVFWPQPVSRRRRRHWGVHSVRRNTTVDAMGYSHLGSDRRAKRKEKMWKAVSTFPIIIVINFDSKANTEKLRGTFGSLPLGCANGWHMTLRQMVDSTTDGAFHNMVLTKANRRKLRLFFCLCFFLLKKKRI